MSRGCLFLGGFVGYGMIIFRISLPLVEGLTNELTFSLVQERMKWCLLSFDQKSYRGLDPLKETPRRGKAQPLCQLQISVPDIGGDSCSGQGLTSYDEVRAFGRSFHPVYCNPVGTGLGMAESQRS